MEGYIETIYKISMNISDGELHDLLLELNSIIKDEPEDGFDQYQEMRKLYNSIQSWLGRMVETQLL